jgi:hypothetical protein
MTPEQHKIAAEVLADAAKPEFTRNQILYRVTLLAHVAAGPREEFFELQANVNRLLDERKAPFR